MSDGPREEAESIAVELARLIREREQTQTKMLYDHGQTLNLISTAVALIGERTKDFPDLEKRVARLENWRMLITGIAVASSAIGGLVGWAISIVVKH